MRKIMVRFYMLFVGCMLSCLQAMAQSDEDDEFSGSRAMRISDVYDERSLSIGFQDVFMFIVLLGACYFFGKIWKGCSYVLFVLAVIVFYLLH